MITCKLGDKTYSVDFITGRAMREIEPAAKMLSRLSSISDAVAKGKELSSDDKKLNISAAMDTMVRWFCILFQGQFTPEDVYDHYPNDRLMHDIALAILAVQAQTTEALSEFPTIPTAADMLTGTMK